MAVSLPSFKRGDTWSITCQYRQDGKPVSVANMTIKSQIRQPNGQLVDDLIVYKIDQQASPGYFYMVPAKGTTSTLTWPLGNLSIDIMFLTGSGTIISTETFTIPVIDTVTQPN